MNAQKWDYKTHTYSPYELPENCQLFNHNLTEKVACCQCGKEKEFGEMYTSKEIHNEWGLGYPTCEDCYQLEIKEENNNE